MFAAMPRAILQCILFLYAAVQALSQRIHSLNVSSCPGAYFRASNPRSVFHISYRIQTYFSGGKRDRPHSSFGFNGNSMWCLWSRYTRRHRTSNIRNWHSVPKTPHFNWFSLLTRHRFSLHVNIFDAANKQYTIPQSVIERPPPPVKNFTETSDLVFNYESAPFAFWIIRRSEPNASPIFDTRITSLPQTPIAPIIENDNSTALDGFPLVFEDQYLQVGVIDLYHENLNSLDLFVQLASALPLNTNIYGLGEVVASSGFRRNVETTIQTMWARDVGDPVDQNMWVHLCRGRSESLLLIRYGSHPIYMEHRFDENTNISLSHGVFLLRYGHKMYRIYLNCCSSLDLKVLLVEISSSLLLLPQRFL